MSPWPANLLQTDSHMVLKLSRNAEDTFFPSPESTWKSLTVGSAFFQENHLLWDARVIPPAQCNVKEIFSPGKDSHKQPRFS